MTMENEILHADQNMEDEIANGGGEQHDESEEESEVGLEHEPEDSDEGEPFGHYEAAEWIGLRNHPPATSIRITRALQKVAGSGRTNLTVLIIGKAAVGKSTTINSLFATEIVDLPPFSDLTPDRPSPLVIRKRASEVSFAVIDAQGLIDSDQVSETGVKRIAFYTRNSPVDVVMFLDRFDIPRPDELDFQIMQGLTKTFGREIWSRMVIGLTRADMRDLTRGQNYTGMVQTRVEGVRKLMRKAGAKGAQLPFVLIENSEACQRNSNGEKVLQNGEVWIPSMFEKIVEVALCFNQPYRYNPKMVNRRQNFIVKFCWIPLVFAAQILAKLFIIDPMIENDGLCGDLYGPFDEEQQDRARAKQRERQEAEKRRRTQRASKLRQQSKKAMKQQSKREMSLEDEMYEESDEDLSIDES